MADPVTIPQILIRAVTDPRAAFQWLNGMGLQRPALWQILLLLAIGRVLLIGLFDGGRFLVPLGMTPVLVTPMTYTTILVSGFVIMVFLVHYTGRAMGGTGTFLGAMAVAALLEGLSFALVVVQLVVGFVQPALAGVLGLMALPVMLFCALTYIDELHGFGSLLKAFGMILLAFLGLSFGITIFLTLIGAGSAMPGLEGV